MITNKIKLNFWEKWRTFENYGLKLTLFFGRPLPLVLNTRDVELLKEKFYDRHIPHTWNKNISFSSFSISFRKYRRSNVKSEFCCLFLQKLSSDLKYLLNKSKIEKNEIHFLISIFLFSKELHTNYSFSIVMQNAIIINYLKAKF